MLSWIGWKRAALSGMVLLLAAGAARAEWTDAERERLERSALVEPALVAALDGAESADVIVVFESPAEARSRRRAGRGRAELAARADAVLARGAGADFRLRRRYRATGAVAVTVGRPGLLRLLRAPEVVRIGLEQRVTTQMVEALPLVMGDVVQALGHAGAGAVAAVIDTGANAVDIEDAIIEERCWCQGPSGSVGCCPPDNEETNSGPGSAADDDGHGTNVTGVIVANDCCGPIGIAPDAGVIALRALSPSGGTFSDILSALDWVLDERADVVDVINMSLGGFLLPGDCSGANATTMALAMTIDALRDEGVLTVGAAGNDGSGTDMLAPACIDSVVSVGASWDAAQGSQTHFGCTDNPTFADRVTCFTNSNASTDLLAPGALIAPIGGMPNRVGSSFAAPFVTGCAAVLRGALPFLSPDQLETALESSAVMLTDPKNGLDFPRLDCAAALAAARQTVPALSERGAGALFAGLLLAGGAALWAARRERRAER